MTSVVADDEEDLVLAAGGWRLSDQKTQALQALIDQHAAMSIYMSIGLKGGSVEVSSSIRAVAMDIRSQDTTVDCETLFSYIRGMTMTGVSIAGTDSVAMVVCH